MTDARVGKIVAEVLRRLLPRLGADGSQGPLIVVCTGATVGLTETAEQLRALILKGFSLNLVFSEMAEHLYGPWLREQLDGFPQWSQMPPVTWLTALRKAAAVVVPMLSVNALSKLSLLIGDSQAGNLMLHGLFTGKPVIAAKNGAAPDEPGRAELGFDKGGAGLAEAIRARFEVIAGYGCVLSDIGHLADRAAQLAGAPVHHGRSAGTGLEAGAEAARMTIRCAGRPLSAGDVLRAHAERADLMLAAGVVVTPLAQDLIAKHKIRIVRGEPR